MDGGHEIIAFPTAAAVLAAVSSLVPARDTIHNEAQRSLGEGDRNRARAPIHHGSWARTRLGQPLPGRPAQRRRLPIDARIGPTVRAPARLRGGAGPASRPITWHSAGSEASWRHRGWVCVCGGGY